jgi:hypothetical protein
MLSLILVYVSTYSQGNISYLKDSFYTINQEFSEKSTEITDSVFYSRIIIHLHDNFVPVKLKISVTNKEVMIDLNDAEEIKKYAITRGNNMLSISLGNNLLVDTTPGIILYDSQGKSYSLKFKDRAGNLLTGKE